MKKIFNCFTILICFLILGNINDVYAAEIDTGDISNSTYVIGKCMFTRDISDSYSGSLSTDVIMLAAKTIDSNNLEDMIIYYKNARGIWMDVLKNQVVDMDDVVEITYKNNEIYLEKPTLSLGMGNGEDDGSMKDKLTIVAEGAYAGQPNDVISGWELYEKIGNEYKFVEDYTEWSTDWITTEPGEIRTFVARVYILNGEGKKIYSDYSGECVIDNSLKKPTLLVREGSFGGSEGSYFRLTINTKGLDIEPVVWYISGWELYEKVGNEYEFVEEYTEWSTDWITTEPGEIRTYVAKYYIINSKDEKLYSEYSNEYVVDTTLVKPTLLVRQGSGGENGESYLILTINTQGLDIEPVVTYISGWELYEKIGNEYEFVEEYTEWSTDWMTFEPGEVRTYVAKYYVINSKGEKVYSEYSNEYVVDTTLVKPTLLVRQGSGGENGESYLILTINTQGLDIEPVVTYISGWELYEKIGNEYKFVEEYTDWSTDWMTFEPGEVRTYVAKYYVINSKGEKVYSEYSNEYTID